MYKFPVLPKYNLFKDKNTKRKINTPTPKKAKAPTLRLRLCRVV
jgi:hypothetical protein